MLKDLIATLNFLTSIPLITQANVEFRPEKMRFFFPLVGLIIGGIVAIFEVISHSFLSTLSRSWIEVVILIFLTGALHLDGLMDTADGLFSHRPREKKLEIMKDSRVGAMGVIAVISVLGIKFLGLADIEAHRIPLLFLIPAYSRTSMVFGMRFLPYCREMGTAQGFFSKPVIMSEFGLFFIIMFLSWIISLKMILLTLIFFVILALIIWFYKKEMGCITGDMLGGMCETIEALMFLVSSSIF